MDDFNFLSLQEKPAILKFTQVTIAPVYTFMEYISGGTQIHCCFAIDFTASNQKYLSLVYMIVIEDCNKCLK